MPDITITCKEKNNPEQTALVLVSDPALSLDAIVALLVEFWNLPVEKGGQPIGYGLEQNKRPVELTATLADLENQKETAFQMVAIPNFLVIADFSQSAGLKALQIECASAARHITLVVEPEQASFSEMQSRLETWWKLPDTVKGKPVYYDLEIDGETLSFEQLVSELALDQENILQLTQKPGIKLLSVDESNQSEDGSESEENEREEIEDDLVRLVVDEANHSAEHHQNEAITPDQLHISQNQPHIEYLDFDLQISASREGFRSKVLFSPAGEAPGTFVPPDPKDTEIFVLRMGHSRGTRGINSPEWESAQQFGCELFERLFQGEILARLTASLQEAQKQKCGLRIKLFLDEAPELMSLPWEFLYYTSRGIFLASREQTPIVRFLSAPDPRPPMQIDPPLRILGMISGPDNLVRLDVEKEKSNLVSALSPISKGAVSLDWVNGGSLSSLYKHLSNTRAQYHIFHFIGHGGFDEQSGEGFLAMEGPNKLFEKITSARLSSVLLRGQRYLKLVILNACEGGRVGSINPFPGLAPSLILKCGLSAAIAMQFEITDAAAINFAENFYYALAQGLPIDTAVTSARLAIMAAQDDVEWGTPVLYMRSPNGQLFN